MKFRTTCIFVLGAVLAALSSFSQPLNAQGYRTVGVAAQASNAPVAYVYVSNTYGGTLNQPLNQIIAYAVAANGSLMPVAGSPFAADVTAMAVNGKYLFANSIDAKSIESFRMGGNGALTHLQTLDTQSGAGASGCPGLLKMNLDHTGSTLYELELTGGLCEDSTFHAYNIDKTSGKLHDVGSSTPETAFFGAANFIASNQFAYGSNCPYYRTGNIPYIFGFKRNPGGDLSVVLQGSAPPLQFPNLYCPGASATDATNHVVISMQAIDFNNPYITLGPPRLAVYTADVSGNLTTPSTAANMTSTDTGDVVDLRFSPGGTRLAVAGAQSGVELFHFFGTSHPMQYITRLLPGEPIVQVLWDNASHLYILTGYGQLFVYQVNAHSVTNAPGSPYLMANPNHMIVQPKTYTPTL
jgi:hypothetical protein